VHAQTRSDTLTVGCDIWSLPANGTPSGSLGAIIGAYKAITTPRLNHIRQVTGRQVWQRNYYEHIIRSESELQAIRQHIRDNPVHWELAGGPPREPVGATGSRGGPDTPTTRSVARRSVRYGTSWRVSFALAIEGEKRRGVDPASPLYYTLVGGRTMPPPKRSTTHDEPTVLSFINLVSRSQCHD